MTTKQKTEWRAYLVKGIVLLTVAIILIVQPVETILSTILILGIALIVNGTILIITGIGGRKTMKDWSWKVSEGIFYLLSAALLLSKPGMTVVAMPYIIGAWILFSGIVMFAESFGYLDRGFRFWWVELVAGLVVSTLGYLIINSPDGTAGARLIWFMQIAFVMAGVSNIIKAIDYYRKSKMD